MHGDRHTPPLGTEHCCECTAKHLEMVDAHHKALMSDNLEFEIDAAVRVVTEGKAGKELDAASDFLAALFIAAKAKRASGELPRFDR